MTERKKIFQRLQNKQRAAWREHSRAEAAARARSCASRYRYVRYYGGRWSADNPKSGTILGRYSTEEQAAQAVADLLGVPASHLLRSSCPYGRWWT